MRLQAGVRFGGLVVAVALATSIAGAADKQAEAPAMSAEEQAMMQKWHEFMTPGEPHKLLAAKAGSWVGKVTMWQTPDAPPETSPATSEQKLIMDGRYLEDHTQGSFMGMPFAGHGITGYDNMKKKFVSTWIDNMGTGIMMSEGTYDAATKTFTYMGEGPDVMTGKYKPMKGIEKMTGPDQWSMEMLNQTADGKGWWKMMEIVYTRKK